MKKLETKNEESVKTEKDDDKKIETKEFNWSKVYEPLEQGEYKFVLSSTEETNSISIVVEFIISEDGQVSYTDPSINS